MAGNLYGQYAERVYRQLLAEGAGARPVEIVVEPGEGSLTPGCVMVKASSGMFKLAAADDITAGSFLAVLGEDVAAGDSANAEGVAAYAFAEGVFLKDKLIFKSGTALTQAIAGVMRTQNILVKDYIKATGVASGTLNVSRYVITYKANGGTGDDTVSAAAQGGTGVTLKAAATFAAPATKAFSKWNTKADGTGTNYDAGASVTITEDMTLYAIWA